MIKKEKNMWGHSSFIITDNSGKSFEIFEGGNLDLFWTCECLQAQKKFVIDESNKEMFRLLKILFKQVKQKDSKYNPRLVNNEFTWISEDRHEANVLKIVKYKDYFEITFLKNENNYYKMCAICFCNSGSNFQEVQQLFMQMYIYLCNKENISGITK